MHPFLLIKINTHACCIRTYLLSHNGSILHRIRQQINKEFTGPQTHNNIEPCIIIMSTIYYSMSPIWSAHSVHVICLGAVACMYTLSLHNLLSRGDILDDTPPTAVIVPITIPCIIICGN